MRSLLPVGLLLASLSQLVAGGPLLVQTTSGLMQGFQDANTTNVTLNKWLGMPYAADTSYQNRWLPPQPVQVNSTVFNATAYGPACLQGIPNGGNGTEVQSEDCLSINIIAPQNATRLPVYMYIYGGGYDSGSSANPQLDGSFLASRDIVFASFNYRLWLFAFPHSQEFVDAHETQNFALLDVRAAVEWLRDNVAAFGGDPEHIVLGGESVGAETTNQYMSAYRDDPIIIGAVMQSADTSQPMYQVNSQISQVANYVNCTEGPYYIDCLRQKSGTELQQAVFATNTQFQPVIDNITIWKDYVLQTRIGWTAKIPLLIGTNKDEGSILINTEPTAYYPNITAYVTSNSLNMPWASVEMLEQLYPVIPGGESPTAFNACASIWRDAHMRCLASNLGRWRTEALGLPVYRYQFDLVAANLNSLGVSIGTFHGSDVRFVMGTMNTVGLDPPYEPATPYEIGVSDLMVTAWTNFVKDPSLGPRVPGWVQYDPTNPSTLAILGNSTEEAIPGDFFETDIACPYWDTVLPLFPQTFPLCGSWTCSD